MTTERPANPFERCLAQVRVILAVWAWFDGFWLLGLLFAVSYLFYPRSDRPGARKKLNQTVPAAAVAGGIVTAVRLTGTNPPIDYWPQ